MGKVLIDESILQGWADVVREKQGIDDLMKPSVLLEKTREIESGGSVEGLAYDMGEFVLDEDVVQLYTSNGIPHSLGEVPNFILVWTDDFSDLSADNVNPYSANISIGYIWLNGLFGMSQKLTSAFNTDFGVFVSFALVKDAYVVTANSPTSATYCISSDTIPTAEKIGIVQISSVSQKWKAGVTYKYFVSRNWWEVFGNVE